MNAETLRKANSLQSGIDEIDSNLESLNEILKTLNSGDKSLDEILNSGDNSFSLFYTGFDGMEYINKTVAVALLPKIIDELETFKNKWQKEFDEL